MHTVLTSLVLAVAATARAESTVATNPPAGSTPCNVDGSSASLKVDNTSDPRFVLVTSNACPNHHFTNAVGRDPNDAYTQDLSLKIPKVPVFRNNASGYNDKIETAMGSVGITVSNVALFGPATTLQGGDAGITELGTFDCGEGHSTAFGQYHYHIAPYLVDKAQSSPAAQHSPLYGFLVDGFPVYGPYGDDGKTPTDLDACGGHSGDGGGLGYHYHTNAPDGVVPGPGDESTTKNMKPYFASCFRGCILDGKAAQPESYADCIAASTPAPAGSVPTYAGETFALLDPAAYDYSTCPASFLTEYNVELAKQTATQPTRSALRRKPF